MPLVLETKVQIKVTPEAKKYCKSSSGYKASISRPFRVGLDLAGACRAFTVMQIMNDLRLCASLILGPFHTS